MDWTEERWTQLLARYRGALQRYGGEQGPDPFLLHPASESEISELQSRLDRRLPQSYGSFLSTTNGLPARGWSFVPNGGRGGFLPAGRVTRVAWHAPGTTHSFVLPNNGGPIFEVDGSYADYLEGKAEFDCFGHLLHAIAVNEDDQHENVYLDPLDAGPTGEWRAWAFDGDGCSRHESFGQYMESVVTRVESARVFSPDPRSASTRAAVLADQLAEPSQAVRESARGALLAMARDDEPQERRAAMRALAASGHVDDVSAAVAIAREAGDDPVAVGGVMAAVRTREMIPEALHAYVLSVLVGPAGPMHVDDAAIGHKELVVEAWQASRNPYLLPRMLVYRVPGALRSAVEVLRDVAMPAELRRDIAYAIAGSAGHPDGPLPDGLVAASLVAGNDRLQLAQALLRWGATAEALDVASSALAEPSPTGYAFFIELVERRVLGALTPLLDALRTRVHRDLVWVLGYFDDDRALAALVSLLDGSARQDALIALETVGSAGALDALAAAAEAGGLDAARALARHRDPRAVPHLLRAMATPERRSAVTGLRDVRDAGTVDALEDVAAHDEDLDVALIAAHAVVMTDPGRAAGCLESLAPRVHGPSAAIVDRWLALLGDR